MSVTKICSVVSVRGDVSFMHFLMDRTQFVVWVKNVGSICHNNSIFLSYEKNKTVFGPKSKLYAQIYISSEGIYLGQIRGHA